MTNEFNLLNLLKQSATLDTNSIRKAMDDFNSFEDKFRKLQ